MKHQIPYTKICLTVISLADVIANEGDGFLLLWLFYGLFKLYTFIFAESIPDDQ